MASANLRNGLGTAYLQTGLEKCLVVHMNEMFKCVSCSQSVPGVDANLQSFFCINLWPSLLCHHQFQRKESKNVKKWPCVLWRMKRSLITSFNYPTSVLTYTVININGNFITHSQLWKITEKLQTILFINRIYFLNTEHCVCMKVHLMANHRTVGPKNFSDAILCPADCLQLWITYMPTHSKFSGILAFASASSPFTY